MMKSVSRTVLTSALLALVSLPLVGCATEEAEPTSVDPSAPIAVIELDNGNEIQFLEPSPGLLLVSELGKAGVAPQQIEGKKPLDIYREFAPGQDVPKALLAAKLRADNRPADAQPHFAVSKGDSVKSEGSSQLVDNGPRSYIDNEHCDDQWFNNTYCVGSYDWSVCRLNQVGDYAAWHSSVDYVHFAACADIGNVTFKITMGNGTGGIWSLTEGTYRTWSWSDGCAFGCNSSARIDIDNASGDRFHVSMRVRT